MPKSFHHNCIRRVCFLVMVLCIQSFAYAEENFFMFIQSDNKQPFNVTINGKTFSSTASGYVIIPKLSAATYNFNIGFALNAFPEQLFSYTINRDLGFNLKNFGEKGWGLFNFNSLDVTMAKSNALVQQSTPQTIIEINEEPISFNAKPSTVVTVDTIAKNPLVSPQVSPVKDSLALPVANTVVSQSASSANTQVSKVAEEKSNEAISITYVDKQKRVSDTIQIVIPIQNQITPPAITKSDVIPIKIDTLKTINVLAENQPKFLELKSSIDSVSALTQSFTVENNACTKLASDIEVNRLKRKMAQETTDEKMIAEARKVYRNKCFTTAQIRVLSTLFLSDEGRYKFFDVSYATVADPSSYPILQKEFIDQYFANRFKALLK